MAARMLIDPTLRTFREIHTLRADLTRATPADSVAILVRIEELKSKWYKKWRKSHPKR